MRTLCERETQLFELQRLFKAGRTVAVLVDPTIERPEWMDLASPDHCHAVSVPGYETAPHRRPTLIELRDGDDPVLVSSFETALSQADDLDQPLRQIGGWLAAPVASEQLARALGRWMTLRSGTGEARFARFCDPRVLWLMGAISDPEPLGAPQDSISQWRVLDWHGAFWDVPDHHFATQFPGGRRPDGGLVANLARVEVINHALRALRRQGEDIDAPLARSLATRLACRERAVPRESGPARLHALLTDWSQSSHATAPRQRCAS